MKSIIRFFKKLFGFSASATAKGVSISKDKRFCVVVGIENSVRFGSCPGARHDSRYMNQLLKTVSSSVKMLQDSSATKTAVVSAIRDQVAKVPEDGIFILTYSGHGGSQKFADTKDEDDGKDEFLCLYDNYLRDDDIWREVTKCRGKVFLFFDCCHSETMFRAPMLPIIPPKDLLKESKDIPFGATTRDSVIVNSPVDMLVWSGCPDNTYSYGDNAGGLFTNALSTALASGCKTYKEVWTKLKQSKDLKQYSQKPQQTILGNFSVDSPLWD